MLHHSKLTSMLCFLTGHHNFVLSGKKQGRNEFVIRLQPSEAIYMKLTVCVFGLLFATPLRSCVWRDFVHVNIKNTSYLKFIWCLVFLLLQVKQPGLDMSTVQSELDLSYGQRYQGVTIPEAYERLILDTYDLWYLWLFVSIRYIWEVLICAFIGREQLDRSFSWYFAKYETLKMEFGFTA